MTLLALLAVAHLDEVRMLEVSVMRVLVARLTFPLTVLTVVQSG